MAMSQPFPAKLASLFSLLDILEQAARGITRETQKKFVARKSGLRSGSTVRPGTDTPLWNAVIPLVQARLIRKGDRALLARELSLHRARIGEFFDSTSAMPDAERTLRLLLWLSRSDNALPQARHQK